MAADSMFAILLATALAVASSRSDAQCESLPEVPVQGQSKCLVQRRSESVKTSFDFTDPTFTPSQWQCIEDYAREADRLLPGQGRLLQARHFGGAAQATATRPPVLGAGFGTTATRSLAAFGRQMGMKVHHFSPSDPPSDLWVQLDKMVLGEDNISQEECISQLNNLPFGSMLGDFELLLDTPMGEHFLDFYAAARARAEPKVVLTLRESQSWVTARSGFREGLALPLQSPCGQRLDSLQVDNATAAQLFDLHTSLVRCMVPDDMLTEVDVFSQDVIDTNALSEFLGLARPKFWVPYPRINDDNGVQPQRDFLSHTENPKLSICVTGQIGRLELNTKISRLINPSILAGYRVQLFLVLDPRNETTYIHRSAGEVYENHTLVDGPFERLEDTIPYLPSNIAVVFDPYVPVDYPTDPRYVDELVNHADFENNTEAARARAKSHMRQWQVLDRCWQLIEPYKPKVLLRMRDDTAVLEPYAPPTLAEGIHVANCNSAGGLCDKFALAMGQDSMRRYLTLPLRLGRNHMEDLIAVQRSRTEERMNPEGVLYNSMSLGNVTVHLLNPYTAPFLSAKFVPDANQVRDRNPRWFQERAWDIPRYSHLWFFSSGFPRKVAVFGIVETID
ncbi:unnamed protein product [Effrenium voratum]|nr:unnamed protein product [Effrenium voratum]